MIIKIILTLKRYKKSIVSHGLLWIFCVVFLLPVYANENKLTSIYISFPTDISSTKIKSMIQDRCTKVDIKVYKKIKPFNREVRNNKPDAIINLNQFSHIEGYEHFLQGYRNNTDVEQYTLISNDKKININELNGMKIGVVDFLGKELISTKIPELLKVDIQVEGLFKNSSIAPTLLFQKVDAILASKKTYLDEKSKSKLNLISNELDVSMKLVSVSIKNKNKMEQIKKCINGFDEKTNSYMGVEEWK